MNKQPAVIITGPTAAGKTQLAFDLFDALPVRLISVDSAQIYRGMNIGTAKPDSLTLARYPHAMIDIIEPDENYNVADFVSTVKQEMQTAQEAGQLPVLVGGTTMYIQALVHGLDDLPAADARLRAQINIDAEKLGWPAMHLRLQQLNSQVAATIDANDGQRIQRALEVHQIGLEAPRKRCKTSIDTTHDFLQFVITAASRKQLHYQIEERAEQMLQNGLVKEVEVLYKGHNLSKISNSMRCVGYRQTLAMLQGEMPEDELRKAIVQATRQLAKRQLTWIRQRSGMIWIDTEWMDKTAFVLKRIEAFCKQNTTEWGLS